MIVKCPKCRFKYETPVAPGVKELSCVCSRCGFPFSYVVPEDVQNEVHQESTARSQQPSSDIHRERRDRRQDYDQRQRAYERKETYEYDDEGSYEMQEPPPYNRIPSSRGRGCARQLFVIFIVLLVFAVFALRHFYFDRSYTAESIHVQEMPKMTEKDDLLEEIPRENLEDEDDFEEVNPEEPPQWLQGSWTVETPEGPINIFIKGYHIAESFKGETQSGTFYYSKGKLYCNFGKNEESIRMVDLQHQRIDAGGGLMMEKRDY